MGRTLLLIENDVNISQLICDCLSEIGFEIDVAENPEAGLERATSSHYDFIIIDNDLPENQGLNTCQLLRDKMINFPILMLTRHECCQDTASCLESGADDCIAKPFNTSELKARVMARVRRMEGIYDSSAAEQDTKEISAGNMKINLEKRKVCIEGKEIYLTAKEFDLLVFFASSPGRVFNRSQLLDHIWGYGFEGYEHTVNSHINRLRTKIEKDPSKPVFILTVWGVGYKFSEELS